MLRDGERCEGLDTPSWLAKLLRAYALSAFGTWSGVSPDLIILSSFGAPKGDARLSPSDAPLDSQPSPFGASEVSVVLPFAEDLDAAKIHVQAPTAVVFLCGGQCSDIGVRIPLSLRDA